MNRGSRVKNSIKNASYGIGITVANTLVSFVSRTAVIYFLGNEALGLNGLFTEIISMLSLAELGVGMAILYSLYKPLHEEDHEKISALMGLYRTAYGIIAAVTVALGIAITPFIGNLINDVSYDLKYIQMIFLLFVFRTAASYMFSYKTALLNADQKQYVTSIVSSLSQLAVTVFTSILLAVFKSYVLYLIPQILGVLATNIALSKYVDKSYPFLNLKAKLDRTERKEVLRNIKDIFLKRVSGVITSSTDNILISTLVSTLQVGIYSNYNMICNIVRTLKGQLSNGLSASVGNLAVTESSEKCIEVMRQLTVMFFAFASIMTCGLMAVCSQFISKIWLTEEYLLKDVVVYVILFNLFLDVCGEPLWRFMEVSGLFRQDKYVGAFGSAVNLVVSIILGMKIGMMGIFIGTVCTQMIQTVLKTWLLYRKRFEKSPGSYYWMWAKMLIGFTMLLVGNVVLISKIALGNDYVDFIVRGVVSVVVSLGTVWIIFGRCPEFAYTVNMVRKLLKK